MSKSHLSDASPPFDETLCVDLVNRVIDECAPSIDRICSVQDLKSDLIVSLFENVTGQSIRDLISSDDKAQESAHNLQAVIDTLSMDILGISLSHITGEDIVAGNLASLHDLLEVLEGIVLFLNSKKESLKNFPLKRKTCRRTNTSSMSSAMSNKPTTMSYTDGITDIKVKKNETTSLTSSSISPNFKQTRLKPISLKMKTRPHRSVAKRMKSNSSPYPISGSTKSNRSRFDDIKNSASKFAGKEETKDIPTVERVEHKSSNNHSDINRIGVSASEEIITFEPPLTKCKISKLISRKGKIAASDKIQDVENLYDANLENQLRVLLENNNFYRSRTPQIKMLQHRFLRNPSQKKPFTPCNKSFLLPYALRHRSVSRCPRSTRHSRQSLLYENTEQQEVKTPRKVGIIQNLAEEFPGVQLSPAVTNRMNSKYERHIMHMHKKLKACLLKKPQNKIQAEEVVKRQSAVSKLIKKDMQEKKRLREFQEMKRNENNVRYRLRDARLDSARVKGYVDEFHKEMRKKKQKRNISEELIFEKAFLDALKAQKNEVDEICRNVKETRKMDADQHLKYLEALENLYQTHFSMLSEVLNDENHNIKKRSKADKQIENSMQREFREQLKKEIRTMQKTILELIEDVHFRELDAQQFQKNIQM